MSSYLGNYEHITAFWAESKQLSGEWELLISQEHKSHASIPILHVHAYHNSDLDETSG